jgi:hypothetical protein
VLGRLRPGKDGILFVAAVSPWGPLEAVGVRSIAYPALRMSVARISKVVDVRRVESD